MNTTKAKKKESQDKNVSRSVADSVGVVVQPKMKVGAPGDRYENEADRVADQVVTGSEPSIQKQEEEEAAQMSPIEAVSVSQIQACPCDREDSLQKKGLNQSASVASPWLEQQINNSKSGGEALPKNTRSFMETRFGHDFSGVRVHHDSSAATMSSNIQAKAFTNRNHIYFNQGYYSPETSSGKKLIAHELTHTIQQGASQKSDTVQRDLAVAPTTPDAEVIPLTPEQVSAALHYNLNRFANEDELKVIRDVIGLSPEAEHLIDEEFVRSVGRWQASHGLGQDGKLGPNTVATLVAEYQAESTLAPDMAERGRRLDIRTKSNERRNNIDVGGHSDLFDAILSHKNAMLTLLMRINFRFHPDSSGTNLTNNEQDTFITRFRRDVRRVWSFMYALVPAGRNLLRNYLDTYYANIRIVNTATNPHYVAHITRTANAYDNTNPPGAAIGNGGPAADNDNGWLRLGSRDVGLFRGQSRGGFPMRQYTSAHEFGHMMGLPHIHCNTNSNACYGTTRAERANIMGLNNTVTPSNYLPFTTAMRVITGSNWRAR
ncbi:eCIS core domain-containing protein [Sunxiuqinia indica]|uniref:eCIS core domain-containing protein n=1 Tax=Sunxiuqinia indica TaxID=2692584 RepID=UPI001357C428|nr:DUF4157 domain-containing protein [Sunxiuqinia indica]